MCFQLFIVVLCWTAGYKTTCPIGDNKENLEHTPAAAVYHLSGSVQGRARSAFLTSRLDSPSPAPAHAAASLPGKGTKVRLVAVSPCVAAHKQPINTQQCNNTNVN